MKKKNAAEFVNKFTSSSASTVFGTSRDVVSRGACFLPAGDPRGGQERLQESEERRNY